MAGVTLKAVLEYLFGVFSGWMVLTIILCGVWCILMVNPALIEREMIKEARIAFYGGWLYLILGCTAFLTGKLYNFFF